MARRCMKHSFAMVLLWSSGILLRVSSTSSAVVGGRRSVLAFSPASRRHQAAGGATSGFARLTTSSTPGTFSHTSFHTLRSSATNSNSKTTNTPSNSTVLLQQYSSTTTPLFLDDDDESFQRAEVNWYPGHIATAERQLSETLKAVDVVVEVRDGRVCKASSHPKVGEWCAGRPRIVVLTHVDQIPRAAAASWKRAYDIFGAHGHMENEVLNYAQIWNQAKQNKELRGQGGNKPQQPQDKNKQQQQQQQQQLLQQKGVISPVEQVLFVDAKQGQGIHALHRAIFKAGAHVQERRDRRGLKERPLRVGIIGYPNVGKSALINRILGRKRAKTANRPGVTRSLQWIRIKTDEDTSTSTVSGSIGRNGSTNTAAKKKREFELLDSPGIIPAKMVDQSDAILLAACNCIGEAAYDNQAVASYLCEWLKTIHLMGKGDVTAPQWRTKCLERYGFDPLEEIPIEDSVDDDEEEDIDNKAPKRTRLRTGEDMLFQVADNTCRGDPEDASRKILQDFRTGRLGLICLQVAPETELDAGQVKVPIGRMHDNGATNQGSASGGLQNKEEWLQQERQERARRAVQVAKERGLELPTASASTSGTSAKGSESDTVDPTVGKGLFDGW